MGPDTVSSVLAPDQEPSSFPGSPAPAANAPARLPRWIALSEVILVSGLPTQILVASVLVVLMGFTYPSQGQVPLTFLATLNLVDTALVIALLVTFLRLAGESPTAVFIGTRSWRRDAARGLFLVPVVVIVVGGLVLGIRTLAPWTHTVETNPLTAYLDTPLEAGVLFVVAIIAGGVREELQRAFVLHRFGRYLGGERVGLVAFSLLFGALHVDQGVDVAIAIGVLGLWWGLVYIRNRSVVLPMANHAAFNAVQVAVQAFVVPNAA